MLFGLGFRVFMPYSPTISQKTFFPILKFVNSGRSILRHKFRFGSLLNLEDFCLCSLILRHSFVELNTPSVFNKCGRNTFPWSFVTSSKENRTIVSVSSTPSASKLTRGSPITTLLGIVFIKFLCCN